METQYRKICFILQQHALGTHMDYVYEMARTLRFDEGLPLTLMIEKGGCAQDDESWCVAQRFHFAPLRIFENVFTLLLLRARGHRIFYVHYSFLSAISAGLVTKLFGGTVYYWNCGESWNYKRSFFTNAYQKCAYKLIDYLVTGVESLRVGYQKHYGLRSEQIIVIPNWIDLEQITKVASKNQNMREQLSIPKDARVLLFVHKLVKRKGAHLLPEILQALDDQSVHLIVAGDGPKRASIEKKFKEYNLDARVHMLGSVGRKEIENLYRVADVFVMPSEEEGSPHSLIEAMAHEIPFVSFDVGGVKETAPPSVAQYLFEYPDTKNMAIGITKLLNSPEEYRSFQDSEHTWVQNFSKTVIVKKFKSLFEEVHSKGNHCDTCIDNQQNENAR